MISERKVDNSQMLIRRYSARKYVADYPGAAIPLFRELDGRSGAKRV